MCQYPSEEDIIVFCLDIQETLRHFHKASNCPGDYYSFLEIWKKIYKFLLLYNGTKYFSAPIGHSVQANEKHDNMKKLFFWMTLKDHKWIICVDLNMVNSLKVQPRGYTKYLCSLCAQYRRIIGWSHDHYILKGNSRDVQRYSWWHVFHF